MSREATEQAEVGTQRRSTRLVATGVLAMSASAVLTFGLVTLTSGDDSAANNPANGQASPAQTTAQPAEGPTEGTAAGQQGQAAEVDVPALGDVSGQWGVGSASQMTVDGRSVTDLGGMAEIEELVFRSLMFSGESNDLGTITFTLVTPMQLRAVPTATELQGVVAAGALSLNGITREISSLLSVGPARTGMQLTGEIFIDPVEFELSGNELLLDMQIVLER